MGLHFTVVEGLANPIMVGPAASDPLSVPKYRSVLELVRSCDYRGEMLQGAGAGCGCTKTWHCGAGKGTFKGNPFEVALSECLDCIRGVADTPRRY